MKCKTNGFDTNIDSMQLWRSKSVDAEVFLGLLRFFRPQHGADSEMHRFSRAERLQELA